jgi:UMF1 family MFS transporter
MTDSSDLAQRRQIFGWVMYDWANSAFQTTVVTVLAGPYLTALAQHAVGDNGPVLRMAGVTVVTAKSLFPYSVSLSVVLQMGLLPVLGALADYSDAKKRLMATFCYLGVTATCLLFFVSGGLYLAGALLFVAGNVSFGASNVLYNAFLNDITTADRRDAVSSRGYAMGYLGGGVLLGLNLLLLTYAGALGISRELAVRLSLLSAGMWWGVFAVLTFTRLRVRPARVHVPLRAAIARSLTQTRAAFAHLRALPQTLRFLLAYTAYNDGIQTVISVSTVFLAQELFVAQGRDVDDSFLIALVLMIQFVAFGGALLFERIAVLINTRNAILLSLVVWTFVVIDAYAFLRTRPQAWAMGAVLAIVLGGSQALSRSLFSRMIPPGREASFFGLYEISERGTSWIGPFIFGAVAAATNSYRQAILSLIVLFVAGFVILACTDTREAVHEAERQPA